jgi:hypothetical protein
LEDNTKVEVKVGGWRLEAKDKAKSKVEEQTETEVFII